MKLHWGRSTSCVISAKKARPCVDRMSQLARICRRGWNLDCYWNTWIKTSVYCWETWIRVSWLWCLPTEVGVLRTPLFPHLGFLHRIGEHPFGSRCPETGSTYFKPVFFVDDEVETKLEGLEGLGYRRKWKEECRRFFEIIIGFAQVNQCCCFWFFFFPLSTGVIILGGTLIA